MPPRDDRRIPDLISVTEAAALLGKTRQAVLKMVDGGRLPGRKIGNTYVFRRTVVERYADRVTTGRSGTPAPPGPPGG